MYWFLTKNNTVLYVGKAKNIKNRLRSYTRIDQLLPKTAAMVNKAHQTKYIATESELQALLLEAQLINQYQPQYNARLKDDKSPLYIGITNHTYPTIQLIRKTNLTQSDYQRTFGPFPSAGQVKSVIRHLRKVIPWCKSPQSGKPCFYYHIDQCPGACLGQITPQQYSENIQHIIHFLEGSHTAIQSELKQQIEAHANQQDYETAALLKQRLNHISNVVENFRFKKRWRYLPNLPEDTSQQMLLHAKMILAEYYRLPRTYNLHRIEGYDISNVQGKHATGSMVVMIDGQSDKSQYRHFRIRQLDTPDDPGMMKQVIKRRVKHVEWGIPNCIIIDGGRTQLNAVLPHIPWDIPIIGLAKNPDRLIVPTEEGFVEHPLIPEDPATPLFTKVRNESHRFAKRYFSHLHSRSIDP